MLSNCNSLSATRLERALRDFRGHTQHINGLKKELDNVFERIRAIKTKIAQQYPEAYKGKYIVRHDYSLGEFVIPDLYCDLNLFIFSHWCSDGTCAGRR